jgi:MerR family transcriptional regulator, copper efflux regulator
MTRKRTDRKLTIGDIATETGVSTDTLRYYEKMGLIAPIARTRAGYRIYCTDSIRIIRFIRGAKALNFTLDEIRQLMALDTSRQATCAQMHRRAQEKLHEAEQRIRELKAIKTRLSALVSTCPGDASPIAHCPIMQHIKQGGCINVDKRSKLLLAFALAGLLLTLPQQARATRVPHAGGAMTMQPTARTTLPLALN